MTKDESSVIGQDTINKFSGISNIDYVADFIHFTSCTSSFQMLGDDINYNGEHIIECSIETLRFLVLNSIESMNREYGFSLNSIKKADFAKLDNLIPDRYYEVKIKTQIMEMADDTLKAHFVGFCGRYKFYEAKIWVNMYTDYQYTLSIIKPDAVKNGNTQDILRLIEANDLKIATAHINGVNTPLIRTKTITTQEGKMLYDQHASKPFFNDLVSFISSGPSVLSVLCGSEGISKYRKIMGATDPKNAALGTIRNRYAQSIDFNAVHGSDSQKNAEREIQIFFREFSEYLDLTWDFFNTNNGNRVLRTKNNS